MKQKTPDDDLFVEYIDSIRNRGRTMLLPALLKAQKLFGHVSKGHAELIGKQLGVPFADISGVIDFYSMLHEHPKGKNKVGICTSPICVAKGANSLLREAINIDKNFYFESVACLGLCDQAPAALVGDVQIGNADIDGIFQQKQFSPPKVFGNQRILTKNFTFESKPSIDTFLERDGFESLKKALRISPVEVIETIKASGLRGRGGAGFPTGLKWESTAKTENYPKYLVCNADESEPGTFKDQALILGNPFKILEGILIAAYAVGTQKGVFYIRGEYPVAQQIMQDAISQAYQAGYLGEETSLKPFNFDLEIRSGAGAYICGEETALFESIEGKRGFPRIKPPFPTTHGLFNKPTVINNVETFANVPIVFELGIESYREMGSGFSPGPRLFSISGDIENPGLYELPKPVSLREILFKYAGGISGGRDLQGILLGGAAGKFLGPEYLDLMLSEEAVKKEGFFLGSGAIMVFDSSREMREIIASLGNFFAHESCGKCYPCQLGTQRQAEILSRNMNGNLRFGDISRLKDVAWTMTDASLCGLGQTAGSAVLSALELWPELFIEREQQFNE